MPNLLGYLLRNRRTGHDTLIWDRAELQAPQSQGPEGFDLTSPAFEPGAPIPARYRGRLSATDISPPLAWTRPPAGTAELLLVVQDPDVPFGAAATHVLVRGIDPAMLGLPEKGLGNPSPVPGLLHGFGALGHRGWAGPMPPASHGVHTYVFQLFALDQRAVLPERFNLTDAVDAMAGHVIARARLNGTYEVR